MKIRHTSKAGEDDPLKKHERHYRQKLKRQTLSFSNYLYLLTL